MTEELVEPEPIEKSRFTGRRFRVSILETMLLVAVLAVSFRWPGLGVPLVLLFCYVLAQWRDFLSPPTRIALAQVALALYLPAAVPLISVPLELWGDYLAYYSFLPSFIPGNLIARLLPWFDWYNSSPFAREPAICSTITSLATIVVLGLVARRGRLRRIACLILAAALSAASTCFAWLLLHAGA